MKCTICLLTLHMLNYEEKQQMQDIFATDLQRPDKSQNSHILSGSRGFKRSTSLLIAAVNTSDSGTYHCHAQNERGDSDVAMQLVVRSK